MKSVARILLLGGLVMCLIVGGGSLALLLSPLPVQKHEVLFIPEGMTLLEVIGQLEQRSALRAPWLWRTAARLVSRLTPLRVQMGSYELSPTVRHWELFRNILLSRNQLVRRLTIYEGERFPLVAAAIARAIECDSERVAVLLRSGVLPQLWGLEGAPSLEGYVLPATYRAFVQEPPEHLLRRLVRVFERTWQERFATAPQRTGLTRHQILTLASIVEAEVAHPDEYRRIAGVYWNRLRRGMKLEADPTVQYALGFPQRRLVYRDYAVEHPYNTYRTPGLPPGPVAVPSVAAIEAVVNPEQHDYLYFCSIGDGSGRHRFARTYAEHQRNVRLYHRQLHYGASSTHLK